jgi:hypothetical protein
MSGQKLTAGQRVNVEVDGKAVEGVFVRLAASLHDVNAKSAAAVASRRDVGARGATPHAAESAAAIAWVRRSDTGEVEPFELRLVSAV